jgi:hypothetical protein
MAESSAFERVSAEIEKATDLNRLEARGTLRLALKTAGLDAGSISVAQLQVVFEKVMPGELSKRGVSNAASVCEAVMREVKTFAQHDTADKSQPEAVFRRLGGD